MRLQGACFSTTCCLLCGTSDAHEPMMGTLFVTNNMLSRVPHGPLSAAYDTKTEWHDVATVIKTEWSLQWFKAVPC